MMNVATRIPTLSGRKWERFAGMPEHSGERRREQSLKNGRVDRRVKVTFTRYTKFETEG